MSPLSSTSSHSCLNRRSRFTIIAFSISFEKLYSLHFILVLQFWFQISAKCLKEDDPCWIYKEWQRCHYLSVITYVCAGVFWIKWAKWDYVSSTLNNMKSDMPSRVKPGSESDTLHVHHILPVQPYWIVYDHSGVLHWSLMVIRLVASGPTIRPKLLSINYLLVCEK